MNDESVLHPVLLKYKHEHVLPVSAEFDATTQGANPSRTVGKKYLLTLQEYEEEILDSPHAPGSASVSPTASDSAIRQGAQAELNWIYPERSRVLKFFGGDIAAEY